MLMVDYDLPQNNRRRTFYNRIKQYMEEDEAASIKFSTQSVVLTEDAKFALFIADQAREVGGKAHIYEVNEIDCLGLKKQFKELVEISQV